MILIGTAGWNVPKASAEAFPGEGRHLERYATLMRSVEIDSSFHRPHRAATYARWAAQTPAGFRFAVKLPRTVTHQAKLVAIDALLDRFVDEVGGLGDRLAVLLVQLAPSLRFDPSIARDFFVALRRRIDVALVCEPRHASWFTAEADACLVESRVGRVAADPALADVAARPGGWLGPAGDGRATIAYYRWHGSPHVYRSAYDDAWLAARAGEIARWPEACDVWCVFDNTAAGAALDDALRLARTIGPSRAGVVPPRAP